ncbi:class II aldolase/adducin family protein [bacterium]|nr:fuculose phosphate aldolase [bacterium]MBU3956166.1 class II aldolase/adducin family protein [bacterium]MBU4133929.1 class II aldolase/adducin family protein [bacterium]
MLKLNEFIKIGRMLFEENIIHSTSGNISIRDGDSFYITSHGSYAAHLSSENIIRVNMNDKNRDENASVEVDVHRAIYRETDALAIIHAHPLFATVLSFDNDVIMPVDAEGSFYIKEVPVISAENAIGSEEVVMKLPPVIKNYPVCIIKKHGSWAKASTLAECCNLTSVLESACKILYYKKISR